MKNEGISGSLPNVSTGSRLASEPSYEGALTGIEANRLVGWCWDVDRPYEPIEIELFVGTRVVGRGIADQFDPDLATSRKGNGVHRFKVALQTLPEGDGPFEIQLYAHGSATPLGAPFVVEERAGLEALIDVRRVIGLFEGVRDGSAYGWVADVNTTDEVKGLRIEFDGQELVSAGGLQRDNRVIHEGHLISAWRFAVQLPARAIDGKLHEIAAFVDDVQLPGSPTSFGPADVRGALRSVPALARDLQALRERVALLPDVRSTDALVDVLSEQVLDRVDMLLCIYRDGVEAELDVLRSELMRATGGNLSEAPVIAAPRVGSARPSSFSPFSIELTREPERIVRGSVEVGSTAVRIHERTALNLPSHLRPWQTLVIEGSGASSALNLLTWRFEQDGKQIVGRYQLFEGGRWRFQGCLLASGESEARSTSRDTVLIVTPTSAYTESGEGGERLEISRISVADAFVNDTVRAEKPIGLAIHLGAATGGTGWHDAAESEDTWYRWAAASARLSVQLAPGPEMRRLRVVGEDCQPETLENLLLTLNNHTIPFKTALTGRHFQRWTGEGIVPGTLFEADEAWLEFKVPRRLARSPMDANISGDRRVLTVSVRAIALDRVPSARSEAESGKTGAHTPVGRDAVQKADP